MAGRRIRVPAAALCLLLCPSACCHGSTVVRVELQSGLNCGNGSSAVNVHDEQRRYTTTGDTRRWRMTSPAPRERASRQAGRVASTPDCSGGPLTEAPVSPGTTPRGLSDSIAGVLAAAASGQRCAAAAARFGLNGTPVAIEYVGRERSSRGCVRSKPTSPEPVAPSCRQARSRRRRLREVMRQTADRDPARRGRNRRGFGP